MYRVSIRRQHRSGSMERALHLVIGCLLASLAACSWARAAEAGSRPGAGQGAAPGLSAGEPNYCSPIEHMGVEGMLVDQAWQIYRRLEISSPQRKGWCGCAKRCEP